MAHFTIHLPENRLGDVRSGKVKTKTNLNLFSRTRQKFETKTGYIVRVEGSSSQEEYRLFKSKEGRWTTDAEGEKELDSYIHFYLKYFIIEKEISGH